MATFVPISRLSFDFEWLNVDRVRMLFKTWGISTLNKVSAHLKRGIMTEPDHTLWLVEGSGSSDKNLRTELWAHLKFLVSHSPPLTICRRSKRSQYAVCYVVQNNKGEKVNSPSSRSFIIGFEKPRGDRLYLLSAAWFASVIFIFLHRQLFF